MAESPASHNKAKVYDCVASKRKPTMGWAEAEPRFKHIPVIPKPTLAEVGPKISAGKADAVGGTIAAAKPRARIKAIKVTLEAYAKARNVRAIRRAPKTAKGLRLPVLSEIQPKKGPRLWLHT